MNRRFVSSGIAYALACTAAIAAQDPSAAGLAGYQRRLSDTFVLKAGPTFELLRVNRLNEGVLASPALVDGRWYIRTERSLVAIGR